MPSTPKIQPDSVPDAVLDPVTMMIQPDPPAPPATVMPPTMAMAFMTLCQAMEPCFEDQIPEQVRCQEIMGWYDNGNHLVAWKEAVRMLEQVIGAGLGH